MIRRKLNTVMPRALRRGVLVFFAIVLAQLGAAATGQDYPSKPVIVVLALAAGTGLDTVARTYGAPRLTTELFMQIFGLSMIHVPYKNSPQSIADVAAGYVQLAFAEAGASQPLIAARRLRALAVSSLTRFNSLPDVLTLAEATGRPGLEAVSWHAMVTHASTPRPIVNRLHGEMTRILKLPDVRERIASLDLIPIEPPSVEEAQRFCAEKRTLQGGRALRFVLRRHAASGEIASVPVPLRRIGHEAFL